MSSDDLKVPFLKHRQSKSFLIYRLCWTLVWNVFIRPLPKSYCNGWKTLLLKIFGAKIEKGALIYSSARIYNPRKLVMHRGSVLGPDVDCYNVDFVVLGNGAVLSQKCYLCTASHDFDDPEFPLIVSPIYIDEGAWIAADSYVGMGVRIGKHAVVGARSSVFKDVEAWSIVGGNPAKLLKMRDVFPADKK